MRGEPPPSMYRLKQVHSARTQSRSSANAHHKVYINNAITSILAEWHGGGGGCGLGRTSSPAIMRQSS